ncbi:MAG: polysaccharide biosynthesis PFTS motif protein [Desulfotalea sp.]
MSVLKVVYELPTKFDYISIKKYLARDIPVWFVEPHNAYHNRYKKGVRFSPGKFPKYARKMVDDGLVSVVTSEQLDSKGILSFSADKAVDIVEVVYPEYRKKFDKILSYVSDTLRSSSAENVFKNNLCNKLAEFYSINMSLHRIGETIGSGEILYYPHTNVYSYLFIKKLLSGCKHDFFEHDNIDFPAETYVASFLQILRQNFVSLATLLAQVFASCFLGRGSRSEVKSGKIFSYGIAIVSPRQFCTNKRGPDFIIDNEKILPSEIVYFPLIDLNIEQQEILGKLPGEVRQVPKPGRFFSNFPEWKKLFILGIKQSFLRNGEELMLASNVLFNYFRWQTILADVSIRHFITHADFGVGHIGRNIALNKAGVQSWYFTDSMNNGVNLREEGKCRMKHPFWTYLYYDHLVTWDETLVNYHKEHPGSFEKTHIVGCLWSDHIQGKLHALEKIKIPALRKLNNCFILSCFDSTYSRNGRTTYEHGLDFARHLMQLVDEVSDVYVILKEKKDRHVHYELDQVLGPELIELYKKMDLHPKILTCSNEADASELISISDFVISFPFTSTTFEALSANRSAIWHDPAGLFRNTIYGKAGGVVTHSYDELKATVLEYRAIRSESYHKNIQMNSPHMDPYRDGSAIDRFRVLLK